MLPDGTDISAMLQSEGPVVKCVLLRAVKPAAPKKDDTKKPAAKEDEDSKKQSASTDVVPKKRVVLIDLMEEIEIDTSPKKQEVAKVLGGKFTFVGQYEDEGIILMARNVEGMDPMDLPPFNTHVLQPPLDEAEIRGDIVIMKVAATEEELDSDAEGDDEKGEEKEKKDVVVPSNDEFFLDYTKDEFIAFASRTDVVAPVQLDESSEEEDGEEEDDDESDDEYEGDEDADNEEERTGIMNLLMRTILRKFTDENGRGPNTEELLNIRNALAQKMGVPLPEIPSQDEDPKKRKMVLMEPTDSSSPYKSILRREDDDDAADGDADDNVDEEQPPSKRVKFGEDDGKETTTDVVDNEEEKKGEL